MPLTVIDPRSLDQTGDYTVNNITATGVATLSGPANLVIGGGSTDQVLSTNGSGVLSWITAAGGGGGGGGVTSYALEANLPAVATNGDLGYVTGTQKMYLYNGTVWVLVFTATTPNLAPAITSGPAAGYLLSTNGTPIVITMAAQDPESVPITWSYTITAGNLGSVATITRSNNVFTITPSTNTANGGSFELTITASDGVNLANARTYFRLRFTVEEPIYGLNFVSSIAPPTAVFSNSTNLAFGWAIAAEGGTLAVLSYGVTVEGTRDSTRSSVYIYTTLAGVDPVYQTKIDLPTDSTYTSSQVNKMCLTSNMLIVPGRENVAGNSSARRWYVYFKTNDTTWTLTQTIDHGSNSQGNTIPSIMGISSTGLVFACASQAFKTEIYTRDTSATTTWTLRQTILNATMPSTVANNDLFPRFINVSASGRHIAFSGRDPDLVSPAVTDSGKVVIFTNTTYSSGGYTWGATFTYAPTVASNLLTVTNSSMYDDIFYVYTRSGTANDDSLRCLKYTSASNTWSNNTYDSTQVNKFLSFANTASNLVSPSDANLLIALPGPSNSMSFLMVKKNLGFANASGLAVFKFTLADISSNPTNNKLISTWQDANSNIGLDASFNWNASSVIPNPVNQALQALQLSMDESAGELFVTAPTTSWGGITGSGVVHRYKLTASNNSATTKTYLGTTTGVYDLTVPTQCNYMSAVLVGGGGGGCGSINTTDSGGGAGGGACVAFSSYPVVPGLNVRVIIGVGGTASSTRVLAGAGGNSSINYNNTAAVWTAGGGSGGPTSGGGAGGTPVVATGTVATPYYYVLSGTGGSGGSGNVATGYGCGGGGAGGYGSSGGAGQSGSTALTAGPGNNGGGGGGGGSSPGGSGLQGGNVGVYGAGGSGTAVINQLGGAGSVDVGLPSNSFGGGGGGNGYTSSGSGSAGIQGGMRIIFSSAPIYFFGSDAASTSVIARNPAYTGNGG